MNNEIKEILENMKQYGSTTELALLDYITNLQQEKDTYKEQLRITHKDLEHYISRCEKAIEYNNQIIKDTKDFYRPTTDIIYSGDSLIEIATNNIKILQNGSEEK